MNLRRILAAGLLLIHSVWAMGDTLTEDSNEAIELPYRLLQGVGNAQIILLGSSHAPVSGVSTIVESSRQLIASASLVAFEALPGAPATNTKFPRLDSYLDTETYKSLETLTQQDRDLKISWGVVTNMPLPPELAASIFFLRCYRSIDLDLNNIKRDRALSLDQLILDHTPMASQKMALENASELNEFRNAHTMQAAAQMIEGAIRASVSTGICAKLKAFDSSGDALLRARRITELYDHHRTIECTLYACSGWLNGVAFSEARNRSLTNKLSQISKEHGRIAAIVGALHLDRRAGLLQALSDSGFLEISTNIVDDGQ